MVGSVTCRQFCGLWNLAFVASRGWGDIGLDGVGEEKVLALEEGHSLFGKSL
jgi:hypothetical protein